VLVSNPALATTAAEIPLPQTGNVIQIGQVIEKFKTAIMVLTKFSDDISIVDGTSHPNIERLQNSIPGIKEQIPEISVILSASISRQDNNYKDFQTVNALTTKLFRSLNETMFQTITRGHHFSDQNSVWTVMSSLFDISLIFGASSIHYLEVMPPTCILKNKEKIIELWNDPKSNPTWTSFFSGFLIFFVCNSKKTLSKKSIQEVLMEMLSWDSIHIDLAPNGAIDPISLIALLFLEQYHHVGDTWRYEYPKRTDYSDIDFCQIMAMLMYRQHHSGVLSRLARVYNTPLRSGALKAPLLEPFIDSLVKRLDFDQL